MMQDFAFTEAPITIPVGVDIVFTSSEGNVFTYTLRWNRFRERHFYVRGGALTLRNVILCGDNPAWPGGGIDARDQSRLIMEDGAVITNSHGVSGGGVLLVESQFTMHGGVIENNRAGNTGGGVMVSMSTFNMYGGIILDNQAAFWGGGVGVGGVVWMHELGEFNMYGGTIYSNSTLSGGGVSTGFGAFNMRGTSETAIISNNESVLVGGGVYFSSGIFGHISLASSLIGGSIISNQAGSNGGGIAISSRDAITVLPISEDFIISDNSANFGGGIWVTDHPMPIGTVRIELQGAQITNNHAVYDGGAIFTMLGGVYQDPMPIEAYENIIIMPTTQFSGNTAGNGAFNPPSNAANIMPRVASVSAFDHQINNYDINFGSENFGRMAVAMFEEIDVIDFDAVAAFAERFGFDFDEIYEYLTSDSQTRATYGFR